MVAEAKVWRIFRTHANLKDIAAVAAIQNKIIANKTFYVIENFSWANEYTRSLLCYHGN